jgi:DNA (cytosine-5)-methyltransferase 1
MNYLSVCSGIEAATVAWHHMDWKPVGFSEIEKFPSQVLAHHYPQVTNFGDMTKYKEWKLDDSIGLLVGGTPCQSFSVAGLRKGLDDPRGNLALTYVGILDKFRPKWCVWENVPGVLSSGGGRDFGSFLGALGEIGYGWAYRVLDAQYFGVAQRRRRVFVVGCLGGWESSAKVLFESESLSGNIAKGRSSWKETTTDAGISTQLCGPLTARDYKGISSDDCNERYMKMVATPKIANCLETTCNDYSRADGFNMIMQPIPIHAQATQFKGGGENRNNDGKGNGLGIGKPGDPMNTLTTNNVHAVAYENHPSDCRVKEMGDICQTVTSTWGMGGGNIPFVQNVVGSSDISGTLRANPGSGWRSNGTPVEAVAIQNMAVRRLTEVECERLQGFPDNYTNIKENCPSGVRYKALGNSMAVPVMRWIGERINGHEQRGMA